MGESCRGLPAELVALGVTVRVEEPWGVITGGGGVTAAD